MYLHYSDIGILVLYLHITVWKKYTSFIKICASYLFSSFCLKSNVQMFLFVLTGCIDYVHIILCNAKTYKRINLRTHTHAPPHLHTYKFSVRKGHVSVCYPLMHILLAIEGFIKWKSIICHCRHFKAKANAFLPNSLYCCLKIK